MYQDTDFGHEIRDAVRDQAKASKLEVAGEATYGPTDTDFVAPVTKLKSAGCDLVVMGSIIRDSIQAVGTAKKLGWADVAFVGQAASYDPIVAGAPGGIMEGFYSGTGMPYRLRRHELRRDQGLGRQVQGQDQARIPTAPRSTAMLAADIVVKVLEAAGKDLTRAKFLAALEAVKDYKPMFPGPTLSYGADSSIRARRQPSWPRSKAAAGRSLPRT